MKITIGDEQDIGMNQGGQVGQVEGMCRGED